jgi:ABC-type Fe3+/spermidine/putrescine transport system ATPase subunit
MKKNIIEVKNIIKKYGSFTAVDNISFSIKEGDFFSLLGPSGCGKTTTLRMIGGFIDSDSGEIFINDASMKNIAPNKRNTSLVFQNLALFPHMNVKENIIYGLKKRRTPKKIIEEKLSGILKIVNLQGLEKRAITELSGGQQQRVALARSLIIEPEILLLDEPLANLDKKLRISMQFELKEIQRMTGTTFLYVTHDQSEALAMSNTIAVMNCGKIVQIGSPAEIYDNPSSLFTADFIGAGNFIKLKNIKKADKKNILILESELGKTFNYMAANINSPLKSPENDLCSTIFTEKGTEKNTSNSFIFFIRPEKIKILSDEDAAMTGRGNLNIFKGKLDSIVFEGPDIRLIISIPELGILKIEIKNEKKYHFLTENSEIKIYWEYEEGILFCS